MTKTLEERALEAMTQWDKGSVYAQIWIDLIQDQQARIRELEAKNQWQPIETAPKDRTKILAYGLQGWNDDYESYHNEIVPQVVSWYCSDNEDPEEEGKWVVDTCSYYVETLNPTHWMPLPELPNSGE